RLVVALLAVFLPASVYSAEWQAEWEKVLAAAKKENTVVLGIPASTELRNAIGSKFKEKFGIAPELFPSRGPENVTRSIKEYNAGVHYFDELMAGGSRPGRLAASGAAA